MGMDNKPASLTLNLFRYLRRNQFTPGPALSNRAFAARERATASVDAAFAIASSFCRGTKKSLSM